MSALFYDSDTFELYYNEVGVRTTMFHWDDTNKRQGINTDTPLTTLHLVRTEGGAQGVMFQDQYVDGITPSGIITRKARGTPSSPSGVLDGDFIGGFAAVGHDGSNFGNLNLFLFQATEDFTASAQGTRVILQTTPEGSVTAITRIIASPEGNIFIGSAGGTPTSGTLGLIFEDGTALAGMITNTAGLFGNDDGGGTVKMYAIDEGDSIALLNYFNVALGGGAAPTFGTIGGSGPTTAAQDSWIQLNHNGTDYWVAAWV